MDSPVVLYYWKPLQGDLGHVAISIKGNKNNADRYISFYPKNLKVGKQQFKWRDEGRLESYEYDENEHQTSRYKLYTVVFPALDRAKMFEYINQHVDSSRASYTLFSSYIPFVKDTYYTCSSLVFRILEAGGIKNYLPANEQFGSLTHFLMLQYARVFTTILLLQVPIYGLIEKTLNEGGGEYNKLTKQFACKLSFLYTLPSSALVFLLERYFLPKKLLEINGSDIFISLMSSLGFLLLITYHRIYVSHLMYIRKYRPQTKALIDFTCLLPGTMVAALLTGWSGSQISNIFWGNSYTAHPSNVYMWSDYAAKIMRQSKSPESITKMQNYIFRREILSSAVVYSAWILQYLVLKITKNHEKSLVSIPAGIAVGGLLSHSIDKFLLRPKGFHSQFHQIKDQENKKLLITERRMSGYTFAAVFASLGMYSFLLPSVRKMKGKKNYNFSPHKFFDSLKIMLGAGIGFCTGITCLKLVRQFRPTLPSALRPHSPVELPFLRDDEEDLDSNKENVTFSPFSPDIS